MKNFMKIGLLMIFSLVLLACTSYKMPAVIEYSPPEDFIVKCFSVEPDETGDCDDKMPFDSYLEHLINQIDVKQLAVIDDQEEAIKVIKAHFPAIADATNWQTSSRLISQYMTVIRLAPYFEYIKYKYGVPKYVSIAHFINETGWGRSAAWKYKLNPGGVGGDGSLWKFDNLIHSANEWGRVLTLERYLGRIENFHSPKSWFKAYEQGGYWGHPDGYRDRCIVVTKYKLADIEDRILLPAFKPDLAQI